MKVRIYIRASGFFETEISTEEYDKIDKLLEDEEYVDFDQTTLDFTEMINSVEIEIEDMHEIK